MANGFVFSVSDDENDFDINNFKYAVEPSAGDAAPNTAPRHVFSAISETMHTTQATSPQRKLQSSRAERLCESGYNLEDFLSWNTGQRRCHLYGRRNILRTSQSNKL